MAKPTDPDQPRTADEETQEEPTQAATTERQDLRAKYDVKEGGYGTVTERARRAEANRSDQS